ncbi:MAG: PilC/PilY family type IV pilus protein [Polyangiaceae bacterium]|nr:PilC/PilY family type IV pilus protein [Polyangiaceae bacterium]
MHFTRMRARVTFSTAAGVLLASLLGSHTAQAQTNVTTSKALPNVLLLVDNSGSMERMSDGTLPSDNVENACNPGVASSPNRWGILVQALTGNMQPFFSCGKMDRSTGGALVNEYRIAGQKPYDADYFLPYHRPLTGNTLVNACAMGPWRLPGGGGFGVGPTNQSSMDLPAGATADGFPSDALRKLKWTDIQSYYPGAAGGAAIPDSTTNTCDFLQASDGQLDAARDYVRFAMMTFDNDVDPGTGVNQVMPTATTVTPPPAGPFLGMWSYLRSTPFPYPSLHPSLTYGWANYPAEGRPAGCATNTPFEVGARNWGAPPWEGRLVPFADPLGTLNDIERTNDQIQQVIVATRPYGATPIDAMMDDARDYLWENPKGPEQSDPYVTGGCRDQYIILLTDGAPNLNMRPSCEGPAGQCPYPSSTNTPAGTQQSIAWDIANSLYLGTGHHRVRTFVIGFSVNGTNGPTGDGFPANFQVAPNNNCSSWFYSGTAGGFSGNSKVMSDYCHATPPPIGSAADACCQLNEIAYFGSNGTAPPFFAESQRDLAEAFARVLAEITRTASTRTVPAYSAVSTTTKTDGSGTTTNIAASFTASFVPSPIKPWSGQIDRTRMTCNGITMVSQTPQASLGDAFDQNVAQQSYDGARRFITMQGDSLNGTATDSSRTMRPFVTTSPPADGIDAYLGTEISRLNDGTIPMTPDAMMIDDSTCKRSVDMNGNTIPALLKDDCAKVIWGFASATGAAMSAGGYNTWNVRCPSLGSGNKCAINSSTSCNQDSDCNAVTPGDVCVPECAALGAVFRSNPVAVSPPIALSRDEGYQVFATGRKARPSALFVATTDGILHAFKALQEAPPSGKHELWSFVPPAVLSSLASNYPMGQQILLDGSPIVKDIVWERKQSDMYLGNQWHTTLVAGMGSNGPGYYALNVTDVDCSNNDCTSQYEPPSRGSLADVSFAADANAGSAKRGPHFLWQLTDAPKAAGETLLPTIRTSAPDNKNFVALFGHQSGTPAVTTLYFDPDGGTNPREIGVAILPGGSDGPPTKTTTCPRIISNPSQDLSDSANYPRRTAVRQWGTTCAAPVAGRSVTIVRADTGEIIRHFSRLTDAPMALQNQKKVIDSPFDSPMTGVPIVYPSDVGTVAQKVFIGDADGTMWRIDLSSQDPSRWSVSLFQDLLSTGFDSSGLSSQPISVPPIASLDPTGNIVLNVATGDQENLIASADKNIVLSITEGRPDPNGGLTGAVQAKVNWYTVLINGERVTGPMAVFDGTLYFATYLPEPLGNVCGESSQQWVWGVDYFKPQDSSNLKLGGIAKYPDPSAGFVQKVNMTDPTSPAEIPGVAIKQNLNCDETAGIGTADFFGMMQYGTTSSSGSSYSLDIPMAKPAAGSTRGIQVNSVALPQPRTPTIIDSWALVID